MGRHRNRSTWAACCALLVVAACGPSDLLGPDAEQGIEGIALRGPTCPVVRLDDPCPDAPHQAWIDVRTARGGKVTRFRTGEDGRFRVGLRPGRYTLVPESTEPFPYAGELEVEVVAGVYTEVVISFDTGIR
jgi:hypothetical protein